MFYAVVDTVPIKVFDKRNFQIIYFCMYYIQKTNNWCMPEILRFIKYPTVPYITFAN